MSKAKRISQAGLIAVKEKELAQLKEEASTVAENLRFYFDCIGNQEALSLDYTSDSLVGLERIFSRLLKTDSLPADLPFEMFARLVAIYLGEVIARERKGKWVVYDGDYHTLNRIVIQVGDTFCDPLLFVSLLPKAKVVRGLKEGKALYHFAKSADRLGVL